MRRIRYSRSTYQLAHHLGGPKEVRFRVGRSFVIRVSILISLLSLVDVPKIPVPFLEPPLSLLFPEDSADYTAKGLPPLTEGEFEFENRTSPNLLKSFLAVRTNPDTTLSGGILSQLETNEQASSRYTRSLLCLLVGHLAFQAGDFQTAIDRFKEAVRLTPSRNPWAKLYLYKAYRALDEHLRSQPVPWPPEDQRELQDLGKEFDRLKSTYPFLVSKMMALEEALDAQLALFGITNEVQHVVGAGTIRFVDGEVLEEAFAGGMRQHFYDGTLGASLYGVIDEDGPGDARQALNAGRPTVPVSVGTPLHLAAHGSIGIAGTLEKVAVFSPALRLGPGAAGWAQLGIEAFLRSPDEGLAVGDDVVLFSYAFGRTGERSRQRLRNLNVVHLSSLPDTGEEAVDVATASEARSAPEGRSSALVIGINSYDTNGITSLQYATRDAHRVAWALEDVGYEAEVLRDGAATRADILNRLANEVMQSGPEDRLVLYFSGHGVTGVGDVRALLTDGGRAVLTLREVAAVLSYHQGTTMVIADSCFDERELNLSFGDVEPVIFGDNRTTFFLGASKGSIAVESTKLRAGVFTQALVDELRHDRPRWVQGMDPELLALGTTLETVRLAAELHRVEQLPVLLWSDGTAEPSSTTTAVTTSQRLLRHP